MRIQNEQSGSTSLFAQPLAIETIPEQTETGEQSTEIREQGTERQGIGNREQGLEKPGTREQGSEGAEKQGVEEQGSGISRRRAAEEEAEARESRIPVAPKLARGVLETRLEAALAALAQNAAAPTATIRQGHLALLKRWYYRPEARRSGEIFFPDAEDHWPIKAILRGVGRVAAKSILPPPEP
jgi:hypothetical protein